MNQQKINYYHFKNGIFQGTINQGKQQQQSICVYDNSAIYIGSYKDSQHHGRSVIVLAPQLYFIGEFKNGKLQGPFILRSPQYHIYSTSVQNKLNGEVIVVDVVRKLARVWQIQNGQPRWIRQGRYHQNTAYQKILKAMSSQVVLFPSLFQFFSKLPINKYIVYANPSKTVIQLSMHGSRSRKICVCFQQQRLMAAGVMEKGIIMDLGYMFDKKNQIQIQGQIHNNNLNGDGLKHDLLGKKYIFGKFNNGDIRSLDITSSRRQVVEPALTKLKRNIHLHSLEFVNNYLNQRIVFLLKNFYDTIVESELNENKRVVSRGESRQKIIVGLQREMSSNELMYNIKQYNLINQNLKRFR